MISDWDKSRVACAIIDAGMGTAEPVRDSPNAKVRGAEVQRRYGPMSALVLHGVHPDGTQCEALKLIGWQAIAVIVGVSGSLAEKWPTHIQDQYWSPVSCWGSHSP